MILDLHDPMFILNSSNQYHINDTEFFGDGTSSDKRWAGNISLNKYLIYALIFDHSKLDN